MPMTMYILVNNDLKMSTGKIASQVGHVVEKITNDILNKMFEETTPYLVKYQKYLSQGHKKIILKASEKQMKQFLGKEGVFEIIDEGFTEIPPNSLTVIGFYPSDTNELQFKNFRLL